MKKNLFIIAGIFVLRASQTCAQPSTSMPNPVASQRCPMNRSECNRPIGGMAGPKCCMEGGAFARSKIARSTG